MKTSIYPVFIVLSLTFFLDAKILKVSNLDSNHIKIENPTSNSIIVTMGLSEIECQPIEKEGRMFTSISIENYSTLKNVGQPELPSYNVSMAVNDCSYLKAEVLEKEMETIEDIEIYPYLGEVKIKPGGDEFPSFFMDNKIYKSDVSYPASLIEGPNIHKHRGISIADFQITPFSYNAKSKKLKVYKLLKLKITFEGGTRNTDKLLSKEHLKVLTNTTVNGKEYLTGLNRADRSILDDNVDDILIVTIPEFMEAAESLAKWERMKGYDVKIAAQEWSTSTVKSTVHNFYAQTNPKPSFLVIIGDVNQVPTYILNEAISNSELMGSDLEYVCMDGSDDVDPDMSKGRISVTTAEEANGAIKKIIDYELNPPQDENYYKDILACTYFQGTSTSQMNFTASIERSASYLEAMNKYDINRIYYTRESNNPTTYGSMAPDAGKPVPSYLRKPGFAWDGSATDIINGMNSGSFFAFHYDHGQDEGWSSPSFKVSDVSQLSNVGKYPIVNSINCYSGSFHEDLCFAEKMIRVANSGAAGIFAATIWTLTGSNNEIQQTFVNSIWPGLKSSGEPVYMMGDIVEQCYRAIETYYMGNPKHIKTFVGGYHYFGDPTTMFWTDVPKAISVTHGLKVYLLENFKLTGVNIPEGFATLYNKRNGKVVGKVSINSSDVNIEVNENFTEDGDTLTLTITSHNYRPYQIDLLATDDPVNNYNIKKGINKGADKYFISINEYNIELNENYKKVNMSIYSLNGKQVYTYKFNELSKNKKIEIPNLSKGVYFIKLNDGKKNLFKDKLAIF